jgi:hypothetical protein
MFAQITLQPEPDVSLPSLSLSFCSPNRLASLNFGSSSALIILSICNSLTKKIATSCSLQQVNLPTLPDRPLPESPSSVVHSFCKILTPSDTSTHGGFSVLRRHANECLPPLVRTTCFRYYLLHIYGTPSQGQASAQIHCSSGYVHANAHSRARHKGPPWS